MRIALMILGESCRTLTEGARLVKRFSIVAKSGGRLSGKSIAMTGMEID
ncbi:hypothetical protein [Bosea sp. AS-1]|nr:hypothetical protein [Bosea sp. AS-1]